MGMAELFAGGHLRFINGAWRDDNGDPVGIAEVVRCKECKHWERCPYQEHYGVCIRVDYDPPVTHSDDYCSYGERKDNETV